MLLKTWFLLLYLFSNVELDFICFIQLRNLKIKIEMLLEFQNAMNVEIIGF